MNLSIIGDRIEIGGLHVATLHRPLDYGTRDQLTKWLDLGASLDPETIKKDDMYVADLEASLDEAQAEAHEANERARKAEAEAEGYLEVLKNIAFVAGKAGGVSGLDLEKRLLHHPGIPYSIYRVLMDQLAEGQDAARNA